MATFYERKKTPNLGFVDAKESFKRDRDKVLFSDEGPEVESSDVNNEDETEKRNTFFLDMQRSFREKSNERSDLSS